jgi:hypothetical protein
MMNVCTHSYSLVWYDWDQWSAFIDWMALSGINLALAMTGQEEVQYKVFQKFGLDDETIRTWFNGPAFLTWSRGQNEYGNNIAGPLPRSFMKGQWSLNRQILARYRSLGIVGELPGFQGNVPWKMASAQNDTNMTQGGDTGWMYSTDPLFGKIADEWMRVLIEDFGTDHWYQLDGYFNGGTAPWISNSRKKRSGGVQESKPITFKAPPPDGTNPPCKWSDELGNTYLAGCDNNCQEFQTIPEAMAACIADTNCGGITIPQNGKPQLRSSNTPQMSPSHETSYYIINADACHYTDPYPQWLERGAAAYMGLNRTDPQAIWSFQGWAIVDWNTQVQGLSFKGFVDAVPKGKFVVIDMSVDGSGEWQKWGNASYFGAPFIWTTLHDFGGTDGMKGDLSHINQIPFSGMAPNFQSTAWGTGFTPEGIDQNPVYYEFIIDQNFRSAPVADITAQSIDRAHRRYGLKKASAPVATAWALLVNSSYSQDLSVQDGTGIPHLPASYSEFLSDRTTPTRTLCSTFAAWRALLEAASDVNATLEPYRYDLVNLGREVLAQISAPMSQNFSDALSAQRLDSATLTKTGSVYISLLSDVDALVGTDTAFLLGPWIAAARYWGVNASDCGSLSCSDFMEWNARCQLTTWIPVPSNDSIVIPDGPNDYASKHWNGLIEDYYGARAKALLNLALKYAAAGQPLDPKAQDLAQAQLAHAFQTSTSPYPTTPTGDYLAVSQAMFNKYASYFSSC